MTRDVVLVFELTADIHWMKDVVQLPVALAKQTGGKAHVIVRPNHKQFEVKKHVELHYQGNELDDNYNCFENSDFSNIKADYKWHEKACKRASKIGEILILYPFYGNHLKGAMIFKLSRWLRFKNAFVIIKSDGTLNGWYSARIGFKQKLKDHLKWLFVDKIICESESIYTELKRINHHLLSKIVFIPNCPLEIYHTQKVPEFEFRKNVFLFVGRISDVEKGADILIESWLKVFDKIPNWKLWLVGPYSEEFKTLWGEKISNKKAVDSVIWEGNAAPNDLIKYYQNSKIVICSSRKESGPIVLSEAALSGCSFIGTDVGEISKILENLPGLVFETKDLGETMLMFANNSSIANSQAKELYKRMKDRSWDEQVKKLKFNI